ncbi:hypothetical protein [Gulosibacter sp. 10]|uniref:hypothetical protein n=1 Tax=Gulosibacter sp. 10 TaxID=1255570 RepID=UPI000B34CAA6|nr:hypothetical protein [Gulosibacter sp. 10]
MTEREGFPAIRARAYQWRHGAGEVTPVIMLERRKGRKRFLIGPIAYEDAYGFVDSIHDLADAHETAKREAAREEAAQRPSDPSSRAE